MKLPFPFSLGGSFSFLGIVLLSHPPRSTPPYYFSPPLLAPFHLSAYTLIRFLYLGFCPYGHLIFLGFLASLNFRPVLLTSLYCPSFEYPANEQWLRPPSPSPSAPRKKAPHRAPLLSPPFVLLRVAFSLAPDLFSAFSRPRSCHIDTFLSCFPFHPLLSMAGSFGWH